MSIAVARNCSAACAEMLGGRCQGADCPYRNDDSAPLGQPWDDFDPILAAEFRGLNRGLRAARREYRHGIWMGFWIGVLAMFAAMLLLAVIQWAA